MNLKARLVGRVTVAVASLALIAVGAIGTAAAQVRPGDLVTVESAYKVKDLLPPGTYQRVLHGMSMKIEPTERIEWPPPYKDATEKYSSQVELTKDGRSLLGYVAGQPFPIIDANDPDAATKIIWNEVFRPISSDDYDLRWFDCDSVYWGVNRPFFEIAEFELGHYAGYNLVGRTEVEPTPVDPDFKNSGRYYLSLLYPVLAPSSARGTGLIKYRYADPSRDDDAWTYDHNSRRLRRLNYSILDSATGAQSYDPNHYEAWSAKPEDYNFRFLGEREMLAAIDVHKGVDIRCPTDGGASHCPDPWEMRHIYVLEATSRPGRFTSSLYGKEIIYIDSEADFPMFVDLYERHNGTLMNNYTSWLNYADRSRPDSRVAIYPFKREFQVGSSTVNVQTGLSSVCYHPSSNAPNAEGWFINMGAVDKDWFTPEQMERAALGGHGIAD